jgi:hypothetical protein
MYIIIQEEQNFGVVRPVKKSILKSKAFDLVMPLFCNREMISESAIQTELAG